MEYRLARAAHVGGFVGLTFMVSFAVVLGVLHWLAAMDGWVPRYLSHFGLLEYAWLWIVGIVLFAAGAFCLALGLSVALPKNGWAKAALVCVWLVVPCSILIAVFPAAAPGAITTWEGRVHEGAAIGLFLLLGFAMLFLFPALIRGWPVVAWTSLIVGLAFFGITPWMIRGFIEGSEDVLYSERIAMSLHGIWLTVVALWARGETAAIVFGTQTRTPTPQSTH